MYYLLNFTNHSFQSIEAVDDMARALQDISAQGVDIAADVEIISAFGNNIRCSGAAFLKAEEAPEYTDAFVNEQNDAIDEAVWDAITAHKTKRASKAILDAMLALCTNELAESYVTTHASKLTKPIAAEIKSMLDDENLRQLIEDGDMDMECIGDLTDFIQGVLDKNGVATCHPYYTDDADGNFTSCYKAERCAVCGRCCEEKSE